METFKNLAYYIGTGIAYLFIGLGAAVCFACLGIVTLIVLSPMLIGFGCVVLLALFPFLMLFGAVASMLS